jgi:hypothetical protein
MTAEPYVNEIPLMIGGRGRDGVRDFYANHFVSQFPPDIEIVSVSRTIGQGQVVAIFPSAARRKNTYSCRYSRPVALMRPSALTSAH